MAVSSIKISQITKDFNLKSKDVLDIFTADLGIDKKTGATADGEEFELFIQKITLKNQIKNIDKYLSGEATITVKSEGAAEAKAAVKTEAKAEVKAEEKKPETAAPKSDMKAEAKPDAISATALFAISSFSLGRAKT